MKKYKSIKMNVVSMLLLFTVLAIAGMNQNLYGQSVEEKPTGVSYPASLATIITSAPTGIDGYSATLNGSVNPGNESTVVTFEYSTNGNFPEPETPDPITVPAAQSPISGSGYVAVSAAISGLTPGTVYYYRIVAVNGSGTAEGSVALFSTSPPATVTTGIASPVTTTTATLNGTVNANNNSTTVTFEYGVSTGYGTTVTAALSPVTGTTDTPVSAAISGLIPNTTYHFRVVGDNTLGTSYGEDMTFFTSAPTAPTVTTQDATYSLIVNTATLHGLVNASNANAAVTFEYGTTTAYGNTVTADQSPVLGASDTQVSKYITGLVANTTYHYRVAAVNSQGTTYGADMTFFNTAAPYARTDDASNITQTSARLNGTVNPKVLDSGAATTVTFEYGLTAAYGTTVTALESPLTGESNQMVTADLTGLSPYTTYHYRVTATNTNGTGTGDDGTFTTSSLPVVTTEAAAPVGSNSATLNGTVNANGESTTVTFQYGLTTSYGTTVTADQSPVSGSSDTAVSRAITGLANGTTYHFRVVGTNGSGTVYGEDQTFTTGIAPPTVTTNAASEVGIDTATMNGTVNANGLSTTVSFEWGLTTTYDRTNAATPVTVTGTGNTPVSFTPTTLLPYTTYHYRVVAQNAGGTVHGADMTFTTIAAPTVTTNAATSVTTTGATLNGTVNANTLSTTVTFQYGTTTSYGTTVTADQSPVTGTSDTAVSAVITGLTPGLTYHYRVVGANTGGTSYGADMTFATTVGAPIVTTGSASPLSTGAVVTGTVNAQNASTTVTVEYGTTAAYGSSVTADQSPVVGSNDTAITAAISGLAFNQTYHYRVVGTNSSGTTNGADMTFLTTLNPTAITGEATNVQASSAVLNGAANANNGFWYVRFDYGTTIAYGSTQTATPSQVNGNANTPVTAVVTGLTPGTTYHFRTTVYGGLTYYGSDATFTTPSGPGVTTGAATPVGITTATVNGTVNANGESTTVIFEYGFTTSYGKMVPADQSPVTGAVNTPVSAGLDTLIPGTTYHYRAVGTSVIGTVYGADMTFTTGTVAPTVVTGAAAGVSATTATLNGTVNPNNASTTVTFEYGLTTAYGTTVTADQSPVTGVTATAVSFSLTGLTPSTTYHYRVVGQSGAGTSSGLDMTFTTGTNIPTAVTNAASGIDTVSAVLNGTVNANGSSTTVTFEFGTSTAYGRTLTADQSPVTGTGDTAVTFTIDGLIASTVYHYRVVAQNAFGTAAGADMTFLTAGNAPTVSTGATVSVGGTSAVVSGMVNAQSGSTTVTFEYGLTTAYGSSAAAVPGTVTGDTDTAVTGNLTGLSPTTTYHYRVVGQNAFGTTYGADMTFTTGTVTLPTVTTREITNVTAVSATSGGNVTSEGNGDVTARGVCFGTSPNPTLAAGSVTSDGSGLGAFTSSITGLSGSTTYYVRAYATNSAGTAYGAERSFTTNSGAISVQITNPGEGEQVSGTVTIAAEATSNGAAADAVQAVSRVEFYIDDVILGTDTSAPYEWAWDTTAEANGAHVIKVIAYTTTNESSQDDITVLVFNGESELLVNRTRLNYGAVPKNGSGASGAFYVTYDQLLLINSSNGGTLSWSISENASWLSAAPTSGTGPGLVYVGVDPTGLSAGIYTASLTVENNTSAGDTAVVAVTLVVYDQGGVTGPFGTFSTPVSGTTVMSSIPVTGWVLDDIAVTSVKIYRGAVATDSISGGMVYIGEADMVDGARPDVETTYPDLPLNYQAGWGYMLLTNGLPGDGTYTLYAVAHDMEGNEVTLGSKTITVDNAGAVLPFGAIDTPEQGGEASGSSFVNFGWALTPQPNTIPFDGSTIKVWVDGVSLPGNPVYNVFRQDIADLFPGYNNSDGAVGYMEIDTTAYINGTHTIAWSVTDDVGNSDGIGSRYFTILNTGSASAAASALDPSEFKYSDGYMAVDYRGPVAVQKGFASENSVVELLLDGNNPGRLVIDEVEPVHVQPAVSVAGARAYHLIDGRPMPLPIGSTFDERSGRFSWQPGPGFLGSYFFTFLFKTDTGEFYKFSLEILIEPKYKDKAPAERGLSNY